jgi:hypothetical protein
MSGETWCLSLSAGRCAVSRSHGAKVVLLMYDGAVALPRQYNVKAACVSLFKSGGKKRFLLSATFHSSP